MPKPKTDVQIEVPDEIIKELLTESEWRMVRQRLQIVKLINRGLSVRDIAKRAKVGSDTVVRISKKYTKSDKLKDLFKEKEILPSASKWVFGGTQIEKD